MKRVKIRRFMRVSIVIVSGENVKSIKIAAVEQSVSPYLPRLQLLNSVNT